MSFRLNPYKVLRAIGIVGVFSYAIFTISSYKKSKETVTNEVMKDIKIRTKDFYNSKDYKSNLTLPEQVIENNNTTVVQEMAQAKTTETVNLTPNNNQKNVTQPQQPPKNDDAAKKAEQAKLEQAKKLEQQKIAEQKEAAKKAEAQRQEEIRKKQQQEAARKEQAEQAKAKAKAEAAKKEKEAEARKAREEAAKKARENAKKEQAKGPKKYIQVSSLSSEKAARDMVKKLGGNFYYKKTTVNGKTAFVVMSNMTDSSDKLKAMENQVKSKTGGGYMIRSMGK